MPEDTKKNQQRSRNDPKEQRRRRGRQHAAPAEKKIEREPEPPKVTVPDKPAFEPPPPEFYKSLKRETDEILKITEEARTKYKKKEIQSNWAKYEMPIETYEEIDEQENLGADYEALIQASSSVGSHFQFKYEKSWDTINGPSPYDKYFEINMDNLSIALSSIPFYERNNITTSLFNENDMQTMNHRAAKFKQKYYNDRKYTTPEIEAQNKILDSLAKPDSNDESIETKDNHNNPAINDTSISIENENEKQNEFKEINLENCEDTEVETLELVNDQVVNSDVKESLSNTLKEVDTKSLAKTNIEVLKPLEVVETIVKELKTRDDEEDNTTSVENITIKNETIDNKLLDNNIEDIRNLQIGKDKENIGLSNKTEMLFRPTLLPAEKKAPKAPSPQKEPAKNPVIESPEDLEKWLDDFLDG